MSEQAIFRAIAHPIRRNIMSMLAARAMSVNAVAEQFEMSRPAVTKHLNILREAKLVTSHKQGRETVNQFNPAPLQTVAEWLRFYDHFWDEKLAALASAVEDDNG